MFWRLGPVPWRTADVNSFTAQMSPALTSNPPTVGESIRLRASTPASYQLPLPLATHSLHELAAVTLTSFTAWKFEPSARICGAWFGPRGFVLSPTIGGIE